MISSKQHILVTIYMVFALQSWDNLEDVGEQKHLCILNLGVLLLTNDRYWNLNEIRSALGSIIYTVHH